jgi:hypothetical protein
MPRPIDPYSVELPHNLTFEILKRCSQAERVEVSMELNKCVRNRLAVRVRSANPDWTDAQVKAEVARRWLNGEVDED